MISVNPWLTSSSRHPNNTSSRLGLAGISNVPVMRVGNGTWSKPWMRRISSATSAGRVTSLRYAGTVSVQVEPCPSFTSMSSEAKIDFNLSLEMSVPRNLASQPKSKSTCASWTVAVSACSVAANTLAPAHSVNNWAQRFAAKQTVSGSTPRSNRKLASVLRVWRLALFRTVTGLNQAASRITFDVPSDTPLSRPPYTPARHIALEASAITRSLASNSRASPSRVVNDSPWAAFRTTIRPSAILSISKA